MKLKKIFYLPSSSKIHPTSPFPFSFPSRFPLPFSSRFPLPFLLFRSKLRKTHTTSTKKKEEREKKKKEFNKYS
jgi:hypothetical protein